MAARVRELLAPVDVSAAEPQGWLPPPLGSSQSPAPADDAEPAISHSRIATPASAGDRLLPESAVTGRAAWFHRLRAVPARRTMVAVAGLATIVAVVAAVMVISSPPRPRTVGARAQSPTANPTSPSPSSRATLSASASASASSAAAVVVDVAGLVNNPGLYRLVSGSRVDDALRAAGGPAPGADLSLLNRARLLVDGEQVAVGIPGAPAGPTGRITSGTAGPAAAGSSGKVNLNLADLAALDALPGVGPVLAQQILDWRQQHGRFTSVEQLREVTGIGTAKFASLRDLVAV